MANRFYSQFKEKKTSAKDKRPSPGLGSIPNDKYEKENPHGWAKAPGSKGPSWKPAAKGFTEVKAHVVQDLGDDHGMMKKTPMEKDMKRHMKKMPRSKMDY